MKEIRQIPQVSKCAAENKRRKSVDCCGLHSYGRKFMMYLSRETLLSNFIVNKANKQKLAGELQKKSLFNG
jgi:hypothetical protein